MISLPKIVFCRLGNERIMYGAGVTIRVHYGSIYRCTADLQRDKLFSWFLLFDVISTLPSVVIRSSFILGILLYAVDRVESP